jgi:hypothetical protein
MLNENSINNIGFLGNWENADDSFKQSAIPEYKVIYDGEILNKEAPKQDGSTEENHSTVDGNSKTKNQDMAKWARQTGIVTSSTSGVSTSKNKQDLSNQEPENKIAFSTLRSLSLNRNKINSWKAIDALNCLPQLENLRVQHTPLNENGGSLSIMRQTFIARVKTLKSFNGGEVRNMERSDAEKLYIQRLYKAKLKEVGDTKEQPTLASFVDSLTGEHPRIGELLALHGEPMVKRLNTNGTSTSGGSEALHLTLISNEAKSCTIAPMKKRLPETMTIRQVKLILQRKFKSLRADEMTLYYRDANTSGHPEHLSDDDKDLAYYGIQNGGEIMMEESVGDNVKANNTKEDEAERAKREQIETMEAIRLAQKEEVEAAKVSASNASERKVNAADVVPFVSKIR